MKGELDQGPVDDPGARRVFVWLLVPLAAWLTVISLIAGAGAFFVGPACGCAATPTPYAGGPTPTLPVSADMAEAAARRFTRLPMAANAWPQTGGDPLYELASTAPAGTYAFVDAETSNVLLAFTAGELAGSGAVTWTPTAAQTAATGYLDAAGVNAAGMTGITQLRHRASAAYYEVIWTDDGSGPRWDVYVNASSGVVFAFTDLGLGPKNGLSVPILGAGTATELARASTYAAGEELSDGPEFMLGADPSGHPNFSWFVLFNDGVLSVDAVSGNVSVEKWAK